MPLKSRLETVPVSLPADFEARAEAFLSLLLIWNRKINLVSRKLFREALEEHVISSLAPLAVFDRDEAHLLDIGSGGGFPAIVLLMARPRWKATLVESIRKKCLFLREAAEAIPTARIEVLNERYEDVEPAPPGYDLITSRAVRIDDEMAGQMREDLAPGGTVIAYTAQPAEERAELGAAFRGAGLSTIDPQEIPWAGATLLVARAEPGAEGS